MPSPFPGMDPYLEDPAVWMDFHESFLTYCRDALNVGLPDRYDARIEERISLVALPDEARRFRADVAISADELIEPPSDFGRAASAATATLALEPVTIPLATFEEVHESRVEIRLRADRRLITVIELLSPTNKTGEGKEQYWTKRNALLHTPVHLVELDLLVGGERVPMLRPLPAGHYYVFVARGNRRPECSVYAWSMPSKLPSIAIPLQPPDPDLVLDLAALFATTYDRGRYDRALRYAGPPLAPFDAETAAWIRQQTAAIRPGGTAG